MSGSPGSWFLWEMQIPSLASTEASSAARKLCVRLEFLTFLALITDVVENRGRASWRDIPRHPTLPGGRKIHCCRPGGKFAVFFLMCETPAYWVLDDDAGLQ